MSKKVAILGCGPAGLLARHAAELTRVDADVYSTKIKSKINGAQYLHMAIPDLTDPEPDGVIRVMKWGSKEVYAKKVYGDRQAPSSFDLFMAGDQPAWSLRHAYSSLWQQYGGEVQDARLSATSVLELQRSYDLVMSTIPLSTLCYQHHHFNSQKVWFTPKVECRTHHPNFICYSGDKRDPWYRTSIIFGEASTEWPYGCSRAPLNGSTIEGFKPLDTDCDCLPHMLRLGRFGQWRKGVLTHHAFQEAINALQQL